MRTALRGGLSALLAGALLVPVTGLVAAPANAAPEDGRTRVTSVQKYSQAKAITAGRYYGELPGTTKPLLYRVRRTSPGSSFTYGVTLLNAPEDFRRNQRLESQLYYRVTDKVARKCSHAKFPGRGRVMPLTSLTAFSYNDRGKCGKLTDLALFVWDANGNIPEGTRFALDIREDPKVANPKDLYPSDDGIWQEIEPGPVDQTVRPGTSMVDAPRLAANSDLHVELTPGQVNYFAVPLKEKQKLESLLEITDTSVVGAGKAAEMRLLSPVGGMVNDPEPYQAPASFAGNLTADGITLAAMGTHVTADNRLSSEPGIQSYPTRPAQSAPGWYYVAVYLQPGEGEGKVPATLRTRAIEPFVDMGKRARFSGKVTANLPEPTGPEPAAYSPPPSPEASEGAGGDSGAGAGGTGEDPSAAESAEAGEETAEAPLWVWLLIGAGVLGLVLLGIVGALVGRQRKA